MNYFDVLPVVSLMKHGHKKAFRNLLTRANIKKTIIGNPLLYYKYTMRDGDTLDAMASKYYDTTSRFWFFMYGNEKLDPQWDFGMDSEIFLDYLRHKYCFMDAFSEYMHNKFDGVLAPDVIEARVAERSDEDVLQYCVDTKMRYYKKTTCLDTGSVTESVRIVFIGEGEYRQDETIVEESSFYKATYRNSDNSVTVRTSNHKDALDEGYETIEHIKEVMTTTFGYESIYDYEMNMNKAKRETNVIKDSYSYDMESQLVEIIGNK